MAAALAKMRIARTTTTCSGRRRKTESSAPNVVGAVATAVGSGRVGGKVILAVSGWQVGAVNTEEELAESLLRALADFDLTGTWF